MNICCLRILKPAGLEAVEVRSGESLYARELKSGAVEQKFASTNGVGGRCLHRAAIRPRHAANGAAS